MGIEDRVWTLEQRDAIRELKYEYTRLVDEQQWDEWADLFTEDAVCEYEGWGELQGRDEVREFADEVLDPYFEYTAHLMQQPVVDVDGETATGQWYVEIYYACPDGTAGWRQGRYSDAYRLVDDDWKISQIEHEFHAITELSGERIEHKKFGDITRLG
jgi:ketosteroid isomerase-like protein